MPNSESRRKFVLTVTLNATIDTMLRFREKEHCHRFHAETHVAGGKGLNVSRSLQSLDCPNYATGIIGGKIGQRIQQMMRREQLRHRFFVNKTESRQNIILCLPALRTNNRIFRKTPTITPAEYDAFRQVYTDLLPRASLVVLSGSVLKGLPVTVYAELVRLARRHGIAVMLDASGAALREGLKVRPTFIKPNKTEVHQAIGIRVKTLRDGVRATAAFRRLKIDNIYLTLGEKGAIGCNHNELWYAKAPKVAVKNTVGCGDAFVAAICAGHLRKMDFEESLRFAVAAGTVNATNIVPGLIDPSIVHKMAQEIKLKKIPL